MFRIDLKILLFALLILTPVSDVLIGVSQYLLGGDPERFKANYIFFAPSLVLRAAMLVVAVCLLRRRPGLYVILFAALPLLLTEFIYYLRYEDGSGMFLGVSAISKILFYPIIYYSLFAVRFPHAFLSGWVTFSSLLIGVSVGVGYFSIGFEYWGGAGTMGLMPYGTQNSLSSIFPALIAANAVLFWIQGKRISIFNIALLVFAAYSTGSKMAILSSLVVLFFGALLVSRSWYVRIYSCFVAIPLLVFVLFNLTSFPVYDRLSFHYERSGVEGLLLGGREFKLEMMDHLSPQYEAHENVFGKGYNFKNMFINKYDYFHKRFDNFEVDPVDVFYSWGYYGLAFVYGIWVFFFLSGLGLSRLFLFKSIFLSLIVFQSVLAGHVVFAGMSAVYVVATLFLIRTVPAGANVPVRLIERRNSLSTGRFPAIARL